MLSNNILGNPETLPAPIRSRIEFERREPSYLGEDLEETCTTAIFFSENVNGEISVLTTIVLCYGSGYLNNRDSQICLRYKREKWAVSRPVSGKQHV